MNYKKRYCWICIWLCAAPCVELSAQNIPEQLLEQGRLREAGIAYERTAFLSNNAQEQSVALLGKAFCCKMQGSFAQGVAVLDRVPLFGICDSLRNEVFYQKALLAYLAGQFKESNTVLMMAAQGTPDSLLPPGILLLQALVAGELMQWKQSKTAADRYVNAVSKDSIKCDSLLAIMNRLYKHAPKKRKVKTATILSTVFPGVGQIYSGYPVEALKSWVMLGGAAGYTAYSIFNRYWITAFTLGTGLTQMFYFGGIRRTEYLCNRRNYRKSRKFNDQLRTNLVQDQIKSEQ